MPKQVHCDIELHVDVGVSRGSVPLSMIDAHERYFSRNLEEQSNSRTLPVFRNIGWGPLSCALWCGYAFTSSEPLAPAVPSSSLLPLDITWLASQCLGVADVARIRALFGIDDQRVPRPGDAVRPEMRHDVNNPSAGAPGPASPCVVLHRTSKHNCGDRPQLQLSLRHVARPVELGTC